MRQIYFWARDEIGFRPPLAGVLSKGETGPSGVTYSLRVSNNGLQGKGLIAEGVTVSLIIPAGTNVVAATGTGYQGTRNDDRTKANTAVWQLPRSAPKDQESLTITLSKAGTAHDNIQRRNPLGQARTEDRTERGRGQHRRRSALSARRKLGVLPLPKGRGLGRGGYRSRLSEDASPSPDLRAALASRPLPQGER